MVDKALIYYKQPEDAPSFSVWKSAVRTLLSRMGMPDNAKLAQEVLDYYYTTGHTPSGCLYKELNHSFITREEANE